jgi:hypothetical protein
VGTGLKKFFGPLTGDVAGYNMAESASTVGYVVDGMLTDKY